MRLRGTGKNIRDLRTDIINDMTESRNKNVLNDYEFLKADKKFKSAKKPIEKTTVKTEKFNKYPMSVMKEAIEYVLRKDDRRITHLNRKLGDRIDRLLSEGGLLYKYKDDILKTAEIISNNKKTQRPQRLATRLHERKNIK